MYSFTINPQEPDGKLKATLIYTDERTPIAYVRVSHNSDEFTPVYANKGDTYELDLQAVNGTFLTGKTYFFEGVWINYYKNGLYTFIIIKNIDTLSLAVPKK